MPLCAGESYVKNELPRAGKSELRLYSLLASGEYSARHSSFEKQHNYNLHKAAAHTLESVASLLQNPLDDPRIVVAETQVMIQGREAMGLARLLHFVHLRNFKFVVSNRPPVTGS